jgi:hypothetical protein
VIALTAARQVMRKRRVLIGAASAFVAGGWSVVMAVVVVAMGGTPAPAELAGSLGLPPAAIDAYQRAAASRTGVDCEMRWQVLAGIGQVETNHGAGRDIDPSGTLSPPIIGPVLDGSRGTAKVLDTDGGSLDGDNVYDRAVGPMQFLPSSWALFGADGNADGVSDPNNLYDAALGATRHLCAGGVQVGSDDALQRALLTYNHSDSYVADVVQWIHYFDEATVTGSAASAAPSGSIVDVKGIRVDSSIAASIAAFLSAASRQGLALSGTGFRTRAEQVALRQAHCGTTDYAIYEMPADQCTPPTARPGESMHEQGLAIDFTCGAALVSRGDPCFAFLTGQATSYGLFNLPSEPWHWSTTGR